MKSLQRWQNDFDDNDFVGTILMDLSKADDCLPHDLIIAKFEAYGISKEGLKLLPDYLTSKKQHIKTGSSHSMWSEIRKAVLQRSILGSLLLNVFLNDLLMFIQKAEICNFADENTLYSCGKEFHIIMNDLKHDISIISKRFKVNSVKGNPGK